MARYHLTIHFDDSHNDGTEAAALHASLTVLEAERNGFKVEGAEFVDDLATTTRHGYTVDYLDYLENCEMAENEDSYR